MVFSLSGMEESEKIALGWRRLKGRGGSLPDLKDDRPGWRYTVSLEDDAYRPV